MRIANSPYSMRVLFDDLDELSTILGKEAVKAERFTIYVQLSQTSPTRFLMLSKHEFPGSHAMKIYRQTPADEYPNQIMLSAKGKFARDKVPFFAPEPVVIKSSNDHKGTIYEIMRPPMQRAPQPRSPSAKTLEKLERAREAALQGPRPDAIKGQLPKVPPQVPIEAMDEASAVMTLKAAITTINAAKDRNGDRMLMTVMKNGKLRVMVAYGEDADPEEPPPIVVVGGE